MSSFQLWHTGSRTWSRLFGGKKRRREEEHEEHEEHNGRGSKEAKREEDVRSTETPVKQEVPKEVDDISDIQVRL